jgi:hypothetical protein
MTILIERASPRVRTYLEGKPEIAEAIVEEQKKAPFPAGYTPSVIEVFFDGMIFLRWKQGRIAYLRNHPSTYVPDVVQIDFDEQVALISVLREFLVDRVTYMASLDQLLQPNKAEKN